MALRYLGISTALVMGTLSFSACSFEKPSPPTNTFQIVLKDQPSPSVIPESLMTSFLERLEFDRSIGLQNTPTSPSDFQCVAVNVTGEGVSGPMMLPNNCTSSDNFSQRGPGIISPLISRGGSISMEVPAGRARTIDVYGMYPNSGSGCVDIGTSAGYLLGRVTADLIEPKTITIPVAYSGGTSSFSCTPPAPLPGMGELVFGDGGDGSVTHSSGVFSNPEADTTKIPGRVFNASRRIVGISPDGRNIGLGAPGIDSTHFVAGDEILWVVMAATNSVACGGGLHPGRWGFRKVEAVNHATGVLTVSGSMAPNPATVIQSRLAENTLTNPFCMIQAVRVARLSSLTFGSTASMTVPSFSFTSGTGGVIAIKVNGPVNVAGGAPYIDASSAGFTHTSGSGGQGGSYTGPGTSANTANGSGGGGGTSPSSAGGGGNGVTGGAGGNGGGTIGAAGDYTSCPDGTFPCVFAGSAGGAVTTTYGGPGGGMVFFFAKQMNITGGTFTIKAKGGPGLTSTTYSAGGGAGGSIFVRTQASSSLVHLFVDGGPGGASTSGSSGGGGGGGVIKYDYCSGAAPTTTSAPGGAAGTTGGVAGVAGGTFSGGMTFNNPSAPHCSL